jgi:hypothetical protein
MYVCMYVCMCVCVREREREKETDIDHCNWKAYLETSSPLLLYYQGIEARLPERRRDLFCSYSVHIGLGDIPVS